MNTIVKVTSMAMLMLMTSLGFAKDPKLKISIGKDVKSVVFEYETQGHEALLKLVNADGIVMYSEHIDESEVYRKSFDLSNVADGDYTVSVENELIILSNTISVGNGMVIAVDEKEINKPLFKMKGSKISVNFLNMNQEKVLLSVYDENDNEMYKEVVSEIKVEEAFNFENANANTYTIMLKTKENTYYKNVFVK